jgi:hypothetical protein
MRLRARFWPTGGTAWFVFVVSLSLLLPFAFPVFPSQDGPSHIGTSAILNRLLLLRDPLFAAFFIALPPSTNSLIHYIGMPLVLLFRARLAEEIIVSGLIAGGALAIWSCARAEKAPNAWICAFAGPAAYGKALFAGNYNFILGFIFYFLILRATIMAAGRFDIRRGGWLAVLLLLAALSHPVGAVFAMAGCGVLHVWNAWLAAGATAGARRSAAIAQRMLVPALAAVPALLLLGFYLASHWDAAAEQGAGVRYGVQLSVRLKRLVGLGQLYTVDNWQIIVCGAGALCLIVLFGLTLRERLRAFRANGVHELADGLLLVAMTMLVLYLAIPDGGAGAGYIAARLDLVPWLVVLIWLGTRDLGPIARAAAIMLVGPVGLALLVTNALAIAKVQPELALLRQAEALLAPGSTVLEISARGKPIYRFPGQGYLQNDPFEHMQHYVAADRGIVMLNNWNAHFPGFPIHFRYDADPYRFFAPADLFDMDLAAYETETGHAIDAILVLAATPSDLEREHGALLATLRRLYCPRAIPATVGTMFVHHAADGSCPPAVTSTGAARERPGSGPDPARAPSPPSPPRESAD